MRITSVKRLLSWFGFLALTGASLVGLVLVLASIVLLASTHGNVAQAQSCATGESITLSPTSGPPGTRVTVDGNNFGPGRTVRITIDNDRQGTTSVRNNGTFSQAFNMPDQPRGSVTVTATSEYTVPRPSSSVGPGTPIPPTPTPLSCEDTATGSFTVDTEVNLAGDEGAVGSTFSISGSGFGEREVIEVRFGADELPCGARSDRSGRATVSCRVPALAAGSYRVIVNGYQAGTFTIQSTFSLAPLKGPPGTTVRLAGTGFEPGGRVQVTIGGTTLPPVFANSDGAVGSQIQIPNISGGPQVLSATGTDGSGGQASFEITPTLAVAPTEGTPGDVLRVTGTAFRANETGITVRFGGTAVASGVVADGRGFWQTNITIPQTTAGNHTVSASGAGTTNAPVQRVSVGTSVGLTSDGGPPGTEVTFRGSGAVANERITLNIGDGLDSVVTEADRNGVWSAKVKIPEAPQGELRVIIIGSISGRSTGKSINVEPVISSSASKGPPGSMLTLSGKGFPADQAGIQISFGNDQVDAANSDRTGSWQHEITVPALPAGTVLVTVGGDGSDLRTPFTIVPVISVDNQQAKPGDLLTVTGNGFYANETGISIRLGRTTVAQSINAHSNGSWTESFMAPGIAGGSYSLAASGFRTPPGAAANIPLDIQRFIELDPAEGPPDSRVTVTGQGFGASEQGLTVTYGGQVIASGINVDGQGNFSRTVVVPASPRGPHPITVSGGSLSQRTPPTATFRVVPKIALSISSGVPGEDVEITGAGFGANEGGIAVAFSDEVVLSELSAGPMGGLAATLRVPASVGGNHGVAVISSAGGSPSRLDMPFSVTPRVVLDQDTGNVGSTVQVTGFGFEAGSNIAISYDGSPVGAATTDLRGSFAAPVEIPQSAAGEHSIGIADGAGNALELAFEMEDVAPPAPTLQLPENEQTGGFFGGFRPETQWTAVDDPSGVRYNVQISEDPEFRTLFHEEAGLTEPEFALPEEMALPKGTYYWRAQAVDLAGNTGPFSEAFTVNSGRISVWVFWPVVVVIMGALGAAAAYFFLRRARRREQPALPFPEFVRISRPEIAAPVETEVTQQPPAATPPRRALPSPFRRGGGRNEMTPEQRAQMQLVTDFVQSIPLMEVSPDLEWMEELVIMLGGNANTARDQLLAGGLEAEYAPMWMQHPTFIEMQGLEQAAPLLAGLDEYVARVNECSSNAMSLMRRIDRDLENAGATDILPEMRWRFVMSVAQSTTAWFRGTFLGQPSVRDYELRPSANGEEGALHGVDNVPFAGQILEGLPLAGAEYYRDLHIQLRNDYRNDEAARLLVTRITSARTMGAQLESNIAQMGQQRQD